LPFTLYKWKVRKFNKKWKIYRSQEKERFMKAHGLSGVKTVEELKVMSGINETKGYSSVNLDNAKKKTVFHTYVQFEKKLVSMEQIERTRLMVDFGLKIDNYMMNLAI
jgi:hypothetical protein